MSNNVPPLVAECFSRMVKKLESIEMAQLATILWGRKGKKEKGRNARSGATGWPAEILPAGSSIEVQGRQVMESPSVPILRTHGVCSDKDLLSVIYHGSMDLHQK